MKCLSILGASGHGKVVADAAAATGEWSEIVFFDDQWPNVKKCSVWDVIGDTNKLLENVKKYNNVVIAIGDNHSRIDKQNILEQNGAQLPVIIHPAASVSPYAEINEGTVIFAGAIVNIGASIGKGCVINTGSTIDHDCVLGEGVHVSPGVNLAGGVIVGEKSWLGIGACVRHLISIGQNVVVGAGAAVVSDIDNAETVVGVPAEKLRNN